MGVSFDKIDGVIWYDGKLVPWGDANVHVLTHGLHYASAVFEGERAYGGTIFKGTEHSERLKNSARILDFEIPWSVAEIDAAKQLVLEKNNLPDAYVRPVAWRGSEMMGVSAQSNTIHLAVACWTWPSYFDPAERLKGIRLGLAEYRRPDPATIPALAKSSPSSCVARANSGLKPFGSATGTGSGNRPVSSASKAARAAPILALAASSWCSAARMSGRRSSRSDGRPGGTSGSFGDASSPGTAFICCSSAAGSGAPASSTISFMSSATWRVYMVTLACAVSTVVSASATSIAV